MAYGRHLSEVMKLGGRPCKIVDISTGKIGKQARLNRKIQEEKIKLDRSALESGAPSWLNPLAAEEYTRVVTEAKKINLFDNLDLSVLAIYADSYSRYVDAAQKIQELGMTISNETGKVFLSPYIIIADKAASQILKCSTKLGLSVTDRLKLIVPTKEEKSVNKFLMDLS